VQNWLIGRRPGRLDVFRKLARARLAVGGHELRIAGNVGVLLRFLSVTKVRIMAMTDLLLERPTRRALPSGPGKGPGGALLPLSSGPNLGYVAVGGGSFQLQAPSGSS
jgi:hypothetical protein